jgi:hypothetical protein
MQDHRGSPENTGTHLTAIQLSRFRTSDTIRFSLTFLPSPVIRTHPVTGFKSLFVNREYVTSCVWDQTDNCNVKRFTKRIVELSPEESDDVLKFLFEHVTQNHDLQVRFFFFIFDVIRLHFWHSKGTIPLEVQWRCDLGQQGNLPHRHVSLHLWYTYPMALI